MARGSTSLVSSDSRFSLASLDARHIQTTTMASHAANSTPQTDHMTLLIRVGGTGSRRTAAVDGSSAPGPSSHSPRRERGVAFARVGGTADGPASGIDVDRFDPTGAAPPSCFSRGTNSLDTGS